MTSVIKWGEIKASFATSRLKNFPKCGVRYQNVDGHALVLVHPDVKDQALIREKRLAAQIKSKKSVRICLIPPSFAKAAKI